MAITNYIQSVILSLKNKGFKATAKSHGKIVLIGVFVFYLIRDSVLYLILPYLVASYW